jgi:hypothetical protein
MIKKVLFFIGIYLVLFSSIPLFSQSSGEAASYLDALGQQYEEISKEMWDYTSTMAHSRSARKVEKKRIELLKTVAKSVKNVSRMKSFYEDYSLRDSVVSYLTLNFNVLNNDFAKIINMEEVSEQSYDLMEAYLLAKELTNKKLEIAADNLDKQYTAFANKYNVTLVENKDKISIKLKRSSEALEYYNKVYLVFFKAYKQEMYLLDALERKDINSIEQNRNALNTISKEGIEKLGEIKHFKGDYSINSSCKRMLNFFIDETENKIPFIADFILDSEEYNKMKTIFESKDRMLLTNEEIDKYNKAVDTYNKGINKFNTTNKTLYNKRNSNINLWNNSVGSYMSRHIPKK